MKVSNPINHWAWLGMIERFEYPEIQGEQFLVESFIANRRTVQKDDCLNVQMAICQQLILCIFAIFSSKKCNAASCSFVHTPLLVLADDGMIGVLYGMARCCWGFGLILIRAAFQCHRLLFSCPPQARHPPRSRRSPSRSLSGTEEQPPPPHPHPQAD